MINGMRLFQKAKSTPDVATVQTARSLDSDMLRFVGNINGVEAQLYEQLRIQVPVIDACISKIIRLTGDFKVKCSDKRYQEELDDFIGNVRVGVAGQSLYSFMDCYLDSLLTYGNAVGEILINADTKQLAGLYNADSTIVSVRAGQNPIDREFYVGRGEEAVKIPHPERLIYSTLNPTAKNPRGVSILRGLPSISGILLRIYECIGQNFDRVGNVRYAVTYRPTSDSGDKAFAKERAMQIAQEWSDGMNATRDGQIRDFVAVGDIDIKVIGAENQVLDTEIPVRQLLEQIVAKLSIPPFLLGLSWSTTERMSKQQADMLTSELEFYRRLLTPVISQICTTFLRLLGSDCGVEVEWSHINLQDECELALARLHNAQAREIEVSLEEKEKGLVG